MFQRGEQASRRARCQTNPTREINQPSGLLTDLVQKIECPINALYRSHVEPTIPTSGNWRKRFPLGRNLPCCSGCYSVCRDPGGNSEEDDDGLSSQTLSHDICGPG